MQITKSPAFVIDSVNPALSDVQFQFEYGDGRHRFEEVISELFELCFES